MSLIATAVKHMMDAGMPSEAILAAIADMESKIAPSRSKGADRQARYRERNKASQSVTSDENVTSTPSLSPPNDNNLTPPIPTPEYIPPARKGTDFPMLDCADDELWRDFLKNRKAKKLSNTATAHKRLVNDLTAMSARTGWPPGEVFAACVAKGWGAIYDPRDKNNGNDGRNSKNSNGNARPVNGFAAALRHVADGPPVEPFGIDR
jgi:hypothetical protein